MQIKYILLLLLSLNTTLIYPQTICHKDILNGDKIIEKNRIEDFSKYDFSDLWSSTAEESIYGIIGSDYQRIQIKFLSVVKNEVNPKEYLIFGKSKVKENICEFIGKITIEELKETKREHDGVDDEFKNTGIKTQGLLIAKYAFFESKDQKHAGYFSGKLQSKWYLNKKNEIIYDDINSTADGYFNNAFVGIWTMYNSNTQKICNWGDFRVPKVNCDFDIGAGEFSVSEKYLKNGWLNQKTEIMMPNSTVGKETLTGKKKEWWQ